MTSPYKGVAYYAMMHKEFPVKRALRVFNTVALPCTAVLWNTFGTEKKGMERWFTKCDDRPHLFQVYLTNQVCVRHGKCKRGELFRGWSTVRWNQELENSTPRVVKKVTKRIKEVRNFVEVHANNNTKLVLCPGLEDNWTMQARQNMVNICREVWPYTIVVNPCGGNHKPLGADWLEKHHTNASFPAGTPYVTNLDGEDINFDHRSPTIPNYASPSEIKAWIAKHEARSKCQAIMLWSALHQGLDGSVGGSPPPRKRTPKVPQKDVEDMKKWLK